MMVILLNNISYFYSRHCTLSHPANGQIQLHPVQIQQHQQPGLIDSQAPKVLYVSMLSFPRTIFNLVIYLWKYILVNSERQNDKWAFTISAS